jgi:hypothetical protein
LGFCLDVDNLAWDLINESSETLKEECLSGAHLNGLFSIGSRSDGSGRRMKEVACPICTVHLQVRIQLNFGKPPPLFFLSLFHCLFIWFIISSSPMWLLQVQVPSSGSETIECGVCQHPFLVSAHWFYVHSMRWEPKFLDICDV